MTLTLDRAMRLTDAQLRALAPAKRQALEAEVGAWIRRDTQANQLVYYRVANPDAMKVHGSVAREFGVQGGRKSSKTGTMLAEAAMQMTGMLPMRLAVCATCGQPMVEAQDKTWGHAPTADEHEQTLLYPVVKLRPPIRVRLVVTSNVNAWDENLKQKLQYFEWNGRLNDDGLPGDPRYGHWGWIPQRFLLNGDWAASWSERHRKLTLNLHGDGGSVPGSTLTVMCLRGDQRVLMADGTWTPAAGVEGGDQISGPFGAQPVKAVHVSLGPVPVWRIRTSHGREVVATADHRHFQPDGSARRTDELAPGDTLWVWDESSRASGATLEDWKLGWLGIMLGDGTMRSDYVEFAATPGNRVLADLPPLPPKTHLWTNAKQPTRWRINYDGRTNHGVYNPLKKWLRDVGVWGLKSGEKFVPDVVFRQPTERVAYFLGHLWNCDGTIDGVKRRAAQYTTISRRLAYDVKYLLWRLGIPASISEVTGTCGFTGKAIRAFHVCVTGGGFERLRAALAGEPFADIPTEIRGTPGKIRSIEPAGEAIVYGLEIDHASRAFVVDGLVTHNSHQQAIEDFNQGSYHLIVEDEIPPEEVHRANRIRTLEVRGRVLTGGTPPDNHPGAVAASWFFDQVLAPGLAGSDPERVGAVTLWTEQNRTLEPADVEAVAQGFTADERRAILHGESLHLAGLIIRGFTEKPKAWCVTCIGACAFGLEACPACGSRDLIGYSHVWDEEDLAWPGPADWPTLFYMDPHQAKPTACLWIRLDPNDAAWVVGEQEIEGDAATVKATCEAFERDHGLHPMLRTGDPKITAQTNQFAREFQGQAFNIRRAFEDVGFYFEDANTNFAVGIERLEQRLRPNPLTRAPGFRVWRGCPKTIYQLSRFTWDHEKPGKKHSDFPACARYFAIGEVSYRGLVALRAGAVVSVAAQRGGRNVRTGW